ncbi:MAG: hypothetical protein JXQ83_14455 [Candidatus Glassbacteria bacterium]|nr:hypothetical protein [Candidatus Glassbacteria bacterium]
MLNAWLQFFNPLISLAVFAAVQVLVYRLFPRAGFFRSLMTGLGCGLPAVLIISVLAGCPRAEGNVCLQVVVNVVIYLLLGYCHTVFLLLGETALRIRIMRDLMESPSGLSLAEIYARYNARQIVELRLERLLKHRQLVEKKGMYYTGNPVFYLVARCIRLLQLLVLGGR